MQSVCCKHSQYFRLYFVILWSTSGCLSVVNPVLCISESYIQLKINLNFYFHTALRCLKKFYEALKAFIKPFEASQRSAKIKI